jgi:hypothetical protein
MKTVMNTFMVNRIDEFFGVSRNASSERHGFGRLTKNQLTGFMVGTMKGFIVKKDGFAGSTSIVALSARAPAVKHQLKGFMGAPG